MIKEMKMIGFKLYENMKINLLFIKQILIIQICNKF